MLAVFNNWRLSRAAMESTTIGGRLVSATSSASRHNKGKSRSFQGSALLRLYRTRLNSIWSEVIVTR